MMWRRLFAPSGRKIWIITGSLALLGGCLHTACPPDGNGGGKPQAPLPAPNGSFVHRFQQLQADKAEASDFVIFLDEWYMGGDKLGPSGTKHLHDIVKRLPDVPFPVLIQVETDPALNEVRRRRVVEGLLQLGVAEAEQRVVLGYPEAEGLFGDEADRIYRMILMNGIYQLRFLGGGYGGGFGGFGGYGGFGGGFGGYGGFGGGFGGFGGYGGTGPFGY